MLFKAELTLHSVIGLGQLRAWRMVNNQPPLTRCCTSGACAPPKAAGNGRSVRPRRENGVRAEALQQLLRIEQEGAYAGLVGGSPSPSVEEEKTHLNDLDSRDRAQVTVRVAGTTRMRRRLDWLLQKLLTCPLEEVQPEVQALLRLALYEMTELGIPGHATNAHVELAKSAINRSCAALVNGVLRNAARRRTAGTLPEPKLAPETASLEERADCLGVLHSHPTWLVQRWLERWGDAETADLLAWNNLPPVFCLRVNRLRTTVSELAQRLQSRGVRLAPSELLPDDFLCLNSGLQPVLKSDAVATGLCQVQDQAAGLVVALLDPQPSECVLDACAAPGGKALFAASRMCGQVKKRGQGCLVAVDKSPARLRGLAETAARQGLERGFLRVRPGDLREMGDQLIHAAGPPWTGTPRGFDRGNPALGVADEDVRGAVLVDAPCSGTGVLGKRADMRWRRTPEELEQLVGLQAELLDAAARLVRPGGLLVYATCSLEPEENEEQVACFLERARNFTLQPAPAGLLPPGVLTPEGFLATLPQRHGVDGAFAARLLRAS